MLSHSCGSREVIESFLLANQMKQFASDNQIGFRAKLAAKRDALRTLSATDVNLMMTDAQRLMRYLSAEWQLKIVELASCSVWPKMGQKPWAVGPVPRVAAELVAKDDKDEKAWDILNHVRSAFADLPLIVFERKRSDKQFRIDEGSHRAVAFYLAGFRQAFAFVGKVRNDPDHNGEWDSQ